MSNALNEIARGNTCEGVNRFIIRTLLESVRDYATGAFLDLPCGDGALVEALRRFFPSADVVGGDLQSAAESAEWFHKVDASRPFQLPIRKRDVVLCVSGVMEFDNTLQFFQSCRDHLAPGGLFVVTNDNAVTVRDRLEYLLFGKLRRFDPFGAPGRPTWKFLSLPNLLRLLSDAGFTVRSIRYVSTKPKDWLFLPLALLLAPLQGLYLRCVRSPVPLRQRRAMYPFRSLICRHYVVSCER